MLKTLNIETEFKMTKFEDKSGFLTAAEREQLKKLMRSKKAPGERVRRATILVDLDQGISTSDIKRVLGIDAKTIYNLRVRFEGERLDALNDRPRPPRTRRLSEAQLKKLDEHINANPPSKAAEIVDHVKKTFGIEYSVRGMSKLMRDRGHEWRKPESLPRVADEEAQWKHIASYQWMKLVLEPRHGIFHMDAVHPEHQLRPARAWFHKDAKPAVPCTTGRKRLNVIGALNVADGAFVSEVVPSVNGKSVADFFRKMHEALSDRYDRVIVVLDNASAHYAHEVKEAMKELKDWLVLRFLPAYAPHLNPIERLWGIMHKWITHNKCYATFKEFRERILKFLEQDVPQRWDEMKSYVTDNFRIISHGGHTLYNNT